MESNRAALEGSATAWLQKRELGPLSESDHVELTKWLEASTAHRITFLRLEAAWEEMGRLKILSAALPHHTVPTVEELRLTPIPGSPATSFLLSRARGKRGDGIRFGSRGLWAVAASALLVAVAGVSYWQFVTPSYGTPVGGLTSIPLKDGSNVVLNTDSRIRVQMSQTQRHIELEQGEAFFDVAKDPSRPFTVTAGDKTVVVIGTAFSVRRDGSDLEVVVTEGKVSVQTTSTAPDSRDNAVIAAGSVAYARATGVTVRQTPLSHIEETLSWRTGYLVFETAALPDVVAQFNRYNERKIVIEDPGVNAIELTGKFRSTNVDALIRLLERSFHVQARQDGDEILLSGQPPVRE